METGTKMSGWAVSGFTIAVVCAVLLFLAGPVNKMGWLNFMTVFKVAGIALLGIVAALIISIPGLVISLKHGNGGGATMSVIGILIGLALIGLITLMMAAGKNIPIMNDISTDTANPPQFVKVLEARKGAMVSTVYPSAINPALMLKAFPDIKTLKLNISSGEVFDKALDEAKKMGWLIVDSDKADGRIEATATTGWWGFKDDVVIRITKTGEKSCDFDMRSLSRVGKGDFGINAKRVRAFLQRLYTGQK